MLFILHLIDKYITFKVLTVLIGVLSDTTLLQLMVNSVYGPFLIGTKMTIILRHN